MRRRLIASAADDGGEGKKTQVLERVADPLMSVAAARLRVPDPALSAAAASWRVADPALSAAAARLRVPDPAVSVAAASVRVADILAMLAGGASEAEVLADFPYLSAEDVRASLAYAAQAVDHSIVQAAA